MKIPVYEIDLPEYQVEKEPNHEEVGVLADEHIKRYFLGQNVAIRAIGSSEHNGKSANELIEIIKKLGTDRYDPNRRGDRYENVENKQIDFFALPFRVQEDSKIFEQFTHPFYYWPLQDRGAPVRIDILIVYDISKLEVVSHRYEGRDDIKEDGFVFRDPNDKPGAIKAIFKIV